MSTELRGLAGQALNNVARDRAQSRVMSDMLGRQARAVGMELNQDASHNAAQGLFGTAFGSRDAFEQFNKPQGILGGLREIPAPNSYARHETIRQELQAETDKWLEGAL